MHEYHIAFVHSVMMLVCVLCSAGLRMHILQVISCYICFGQNIIFTFIIIAIFFFNLDNAENHRFNVKDLEPQITYKYKTLYRENDNSAPKNGIRGIFFADFDQTVAKVSGFRYMCLIIIIIERCLF